MWSPAWASDGRSIYLAVQGERSGIVRASATLISGLQPLLEGDVQELRVEADQGDVFIGDYGNNAVKEIVAVNGVVSSTSMIVTVGSGFRSPYGVGVDASGDVFVADTTNNLVKEIVSANGVVSASSTVDTIGSGFGYADGIAVDASGNAEACG